HVQTISIPVLLWKSEGLRYWSTDTGLLTSQGDWTGEFACVPLMVKDTCRGFLLADRNFQGVEVTENDNRLLRLFADVAAIAVENLTVRRVTSETERLEQWTHLFSEAMHKVGGRLSVVDNYVLLIGTGLVENGAGGA